jgi:hypothetical protein
MRIISIRAFAVVALMAPIPAFAQMNIGTGANGGACSGPYCGPGVPPNLGVGATGGPCYGPNCGPIDSPNRNFTYQPLSDPSASSRPDPMADPLRNPNDSNR